MKKHTFEEVVSLLERHPEVNILRLYGDGASEKSISEAEKILNVSFPEDYRNFLKNWGYLYLKGISEWINGISFDKVVSAVDETLDLRKYTALPPHFVAFYSDDGERHWCIDTRYSEGPVIIWNPFEERIADKDEGLGREWYEQGIPFVDLLYGQVELSIRMLECNEHSVSYNQRPQQKYEKAHI